MRKSYGEDKVISVRFNAQEMEMLQHVYCRGKYYTYDTVSGYIKRLIKREYGRLKSLELAQSPPNGV